MIQLLAIPILPLLATVAALGLGRRLPWAGGALIVAAIALSLIGLLLVPDGTAISAIWFESGGYCLTVGLEVAPLTRFAAIIVAGIALGVAIYSLGYMAGKPNWPRFFAELGLFVGAMLALVLSSSLVLLFAAWELVGLASYLLIGFHHEEAGASAAAAKAFLMTRIGDVGLLLGWLLAVAATGTTDVEALVGAIGARQLGPSVVAMIAFLMVAGVVGKSAQLPLTGWLPDAMIGPTPVSALLHSATMVAAGAFLVLRLYPVFAAVPAALVLLLWIGATTALVAGLIATAEMDLKRVLAWSTASQLGEMMIALGLGGPRAATFHLAAHAAFKSTLFLAAGVVQEETGTGRLDRLGGVVRALPLTGVIFVLAALALAGVPPLSGFWSEEAILAIAVRHGPGMALLLVLLALLAGIYIGRAAAAAFLGGPWKRIAGKANWAMRTGMALLALVTAILGWLLSDGLAAFLPFPIVPEPEIGWRLCAVAAGLIGLGVGAGRARRSSAPTLGSLPAHLGAGLMAATAAPARWVTRLGRHLDLFEAGLDKCVRGLAIAAEALARTAQSAERSLDAAAGRTAGAVWRLACDTERAEALGFGRGGDALAAGIDTGGERLRGLQAGRLYLYTLALFVWAGAALVVGGLMVWL